MSEPVLYGAEYSVYTRIARLALLAKGVAHGFETVDVFAAGADRSRHPFGRIPVLAHEGRLLYEACAIARYVDAAFPGPALQPASAWGAARTAQLVSVLDSYAFRPLVLEVYVQRVLRPKPDEARIAAAMQSAQTVLDVLDDFAAEGVLGAGFGLAEAHAAPMLSYFTLAPEGAAALAARPSLAAWWQAMRHHRLLRATRFPAEQAREA